MRDHYGAKPDGKEFIGHLAIQCKTGQGTGAVVEFAQQHQIIEIQREHHVLFGKLLD